MFQLASDGSAITVSARSTQPTVPSSKKTFTPTKEDIQPFFLFKKQGPVIRLSESVVTRSVMQVSKLTDFKYTLLRFAESPNILGWTGYNIANTEPLPKSVIHYLPIIEAPATELSTVNHVLKSALENMELLNLQSIIVVFDQALYCKAQQIRWSDKNLSDKLILRLGEFHTMMCFLATIGKRFTSSGLEDILVEAGVIAAGSMNGVITGKMYNRSIRAHKLMLEALQGLVFQAYLDESSEDERVRFNHLTSQIVGGDKEGRSAAETSLYELITSYSNNRAEHNSLFRYWLSYIDMTLTALAFLRATRTGDFLLHLASLQQMLPWFFAYDRVNYARYGTVYLAEMMMLEDTHPDVFNQLTTVQGSWTYQRNSSSGFNGLAADQTIETTINRETKISGGVTGFTKKAGALQRWLLSKPVKAAISAECERMAGLSKESHKHSELQPSRALQDRDAVIALQTAIKCHINPFDSEHSDLTSLVSGVVLPQETVRDITGAYQTGEKRLAEFQAIAFDNEKHDNFFKTIKSSKLGSFTASKKRGKKAPELQALKSDRSLFIQLLLVAKERDIDLHDILFYSLSPIPGCFSTTDGQSLSKSTKSALLHHLESSFPSCLVTSKPVSSTLIIDMMALIQSLSVSQLPNTFTNLTATVLERVLKIAKQFSSTTIHLVGDQYKEQSIKAGERNRRQQSTQVLKIYSGQQKLPSMWKKYLSSGRNKTALQEFLTEDLVHQSCPYKIRLYVALTQESVKELRFEPNERPRVIARPDLASDHEEADTRLILHASVADEESFDEDILIWSPDTDVAIIGIKHASKIGCRLLMVTGTGKHKRLLNLSHISEELGPVTDLLTAIHAFTGCDTTSSFYGKRKKALYEIVNGSEMYQQSIAGLGLEYSIKTLPVSMEKLVCQIYRTPCEKLQDARYLLLKSTTGEKSLPPSQDALLMHVKRANYQAKIWNMALIPTMNYPSPGGNGWVLEENCLQVQWLSQPHAPQTILKTQKCGCKKSGCKGAACSCHRSGMKCTSLCSCQEILMEKILM